MKTKDLLKYFVSQIVEDPAKVEVEEKETEDEIILSLDVEDTEKGKIIGKRGKTIHALANLLRIGQGQNRKRIQILLSEDKAS